MKPGEAIILAAKKQAEGEIAVHLANIQVYQTMPAGIGEHPDLAPLLIRKTLSGRFCRLPILVLPQRELYL